MNKQFVITLAARQNSPRSLHISTHERRIIFRAGCKYAVVPVGFYGACAYTVHRSPTTAARSAQNHPFCNMQTRIIDRDGFEYDIALVDGRWKGLYPTGNRLTEVGFYKDLP